MKRVEVAVVGGGPAGLAAGVYLARLRRVVSVVDAGSSRVAEIPRTHNYSGHPNGIAGAAGIPGAALLLAACLEDQNRQSLAKADVAIAAGRVLSIRQAHSEVVVQHGTDDTRFDSLRHALQRSGRAGPIGAGIPAGSAHPRPRLSLTDAHQETTVVGLYAAGNVSEGLNPITVDTGKAAIAAARYISR